MNDNLVIMNSLIDEISMGPFGSDITIDNFIQSGVPVLNGSNVSKVSLTEESFNYVSKEKAKSLKKANAKRGDIIVTHRGTLGQISYIPVNSRFDNYIISQSQFRIKLKKELVDPIYFTYYFHTSEGQKRLLSFKNHVGVPALAQPTTNFRLIEFPLRPLAYQKKVAKILTDLDEKIDLNNRINSELEGMAKLIYDYWFVQFDFPISEEQAAAMGRPELIGKPYKSSGGKMAFNEELKRDVPESWEVTKLADVESNIVTGKTPSTKIREYFDGDVPFICIGDVRGNMHITQSELTLSKLGAETQSNKYIPEGSICVTCIASPGLVGFATELSQTNQQLNSIVCQKVENRYYLYFYLIDYFKGAKAKTGNTFANMNKGDFSAINTLVPNNKILIEYAELVDPMIQMVLKRSKENKTLSQLRDWLLPMLMNGQVRVMGEDREVKMAAEPGASYITK